MVQPCLLFLFFEFYPAWIAQQNPQPKIMKIMSAHSWIYRCPPAMPHRTMAHPDAAPARISNHPTSKEITMTWEKPQASDMRWGFEITMYIANR
jgi:coenzyme PQQ precursor peptide PqqA